MNSRNTIRCKKCKAVLTSLSRHDFQSCPCGNFVDGGTVYNRYGGKLEEIEVKQEDGGWKPLITDE